MKVEMTCMTTKKKFEAEDPPVVVLDNGRYAYRVECPWTGKNDKVLYAWKFCSKEAFEAFTARQAAPEPDDDEPSDEEPM